MKEVMLLFGHEGETPPNLPQCSRVVRTRVVGTMTDDERTKIQQAVDRTLASIKAASESYIGAPLTRERVETVASKAMRYPVRFPDWDEATGTATKMVIEPPLDYIDVRFVVESGEN